jgi:hypothetical protein
VKLGWLVKSVWVKGKRQPDGGVACTELGGVVIPLPEKLVFGKEGKSGSCKGGSEDGFLRQSFFP